MSEVQTVGVAASGSLDGGAKRGGDPPRVVGRWALAWTGGALLGVVNGVARDALYRETVGERAAHQLSTATLAALLAGWMLAVDRRWPIPTAREAVRIGAIWAAATVAFELGLGRLVAHRPWAQLLADYDVREGRVWAIIPAEMLAGPLAVQRLGTGR